jgi:hypothetical protein
LKFYFSEQVSNDGALNKLHIDRNFIISTRDNVAASLENEWRSIPAMAGDKLHRVCIFIFLE